MDRAYLVISETEKKLVNADEVEYSDYSRVFTCCQCNATLTLRKEYSRNGHLVPASFVHPEGDISDCSLRVSYNINSSSKPSLERFTSGQSNKKLERAFIKCLESFYFGYRPSILEEYIQFSRLFIYQKNDKIHLKRRIEYNEIQDKVHPDPDLFIAASCTVLRCSRSHNYIDQRIKKIQTKLNLEQKAQKYFSGKERVKGIQAETLIKYHFRDLNDIITKFIGGGASDELRIKFFKIILWGNRISLPVHREDLWTKQELKKSKYESSISLLKRVEEYDERRNNQKKIIQTFESNKLKQMCENPQLLKKIFTDFYKDKELIESNFIQFVLSEVVKSIQFYDWSILPEFYS